MRCADGYLERVYPLLAGFVGNWLEQNDMACMIQSGCQKRLKQWCGQGDEQTGALWTCVSTLAAISQYLETGNMSAIDQQVLKPWWPWWANLPSIQFLGCITPDLWHQLHKGLFKDHMMKWVQSRTGETTC
jgi:hypothetical protein